MNSVLLSQVQQPDFRGTEGEIICADAEASFRLLSLQDSIHSEAPSLPHLDSRLDILRKPETDDLR